MKKVLLATTALAIVAASASAVDVEMYGQVNKSALSYDDGRNTNTVFVDNHKSESRFGLKGAQALDNGLTASFLLESAIASNPSNGFTQSADSAGTSGQPTTPAASPNSFAERQARVGLSGGFGGIYLGDQSTAIDSVRDQDLVGVRDVMGASFASDYGSALQFRNQANGLSGITIANVGAPDVQNRAQSVRYDSPIFAGFQGRAAVAQNGDADASVFYDGAVAGFKVKGAAGYQSIQSRAGTTPLTAAQTNAVNARTDASISVAHASGLAGTVGYNRESLTNKTANQDTPTSWYAKAGYAWDAYEVAADYGQSKHYSSIGVLGAAPAEDKLNSFGLGAQYNMGQGVSVAALYRNLNADRTAVDLKSINLYGVNMRVKF
ncbi:MAG TPA: porin [Alphaproteobacteria bacterium]|nr:porin [Alphaproteobacteria bacterium]